MKGSAPWSKNVSKLNKDRPTWWHSLYYFTIYCLELATYCGFISCVEFLCIFIQLSRWCTVQ